MQRGRRQSTVPVDTPREQIEEGNAELANQVVDGHIQGIRYLLDGR